MKSYTDEFATTLKNAKTMLRNHGVCVIPNVLIKKAQKDCVTEIWDYLEYASSKWKVPIDRNNKETWNMTNFSPTRGMLIQHHSIGHAPFVWNVRQNKKVANVFATLWDCKVDELLTSFDGISLSLPPETTGKGWSHGDGLWLHSDASFINPTVCYQSWVTPIDVNEGDATLAFLTNSHKYHQQVAKDRNITDKSQWHMLTEDELNTYYKYGCELKRIKCSAGSMVLWDSRTIHCGQPPMRNREKPNFRFCIYVCMAPRSDTTKAQIKKRIKAFEELRLTNHNPLQPKLFPAKPSTFRDKTVKEEIMVPQLPQLSALGKLLVGYNPEKIET